jgi:hypothetical protein
VIDSISFSDSLTSKNNIKNASAPTAQPLSQSKMLTGKDVDNKLDITSGDSNPDDNEGQHYRTFEKNILTRHCGCRTIANGGSSR